MKTNGDISQHCRQLSCPREEACVLRSRALLPLPRVRRRPLRCLARCHWLIRHHGRRVLLVHEHGCWHGTACLARIRAGSVESWCPQAHSLARRPHSNGGPVSNAPCHRRSGQPRHDLSCAMSSPPCAVALGKGLLVQRVCSLRAGSIPSTNGLCVSDSRPLDCTLEPRRVRFLPRQMLTKMTPHRASIKQQGGMSLSTLLWSGSPHLADSCRSHWLAPPTARGRSFPSRSLSLACFAEINP